MLSSGKITHPFFIFPENFTHSKRSAAFVVRWGEKLDLGVDYEIRWGYCQLQHRVP
jgi:hypothetical protein